MTETFDLEKAIEADFPDTPIVPREYTGPCVDCPVRRECDGAPLDDEGEGVYCRARILNNF